MLIATALLMIVANAALTLPIRQPAAYPGIDQTVSISGNFLTDPVIVEGINHVKSVVPANLLAIKPSTYNAATPNVPTYNDNAATTCYWPSSQCMRSSDTGNFKADIGNCPTAKDWGLTYDDGPTQGTIGTTQLLAGLASNNNTKATFFIVGANAVQFPDIIKAEDAAGHQLGIHTWTHYPLTSLTNEQIVAELMYTDAIINKASGKSPVYFRPPYGDLDDRVRAIADALGYRSVFWGQDSGDASMATEDDSSAQTVLNTIKGWYNLASGFTSLQHDINPFCTKIGIDALTAIKSVGASFTLKPQPVGSCQGLTQAQWYKTNSSTNSTIATNTGTQGTAVSTNNASTNKALPPPSSSSAASLANIQNFMVSLVLLTGSIRVFGTF